MSQEEQKKVDESWKSQVDKEKKETENSNQPYHEATFSVFLSSLVMQAMIAMGKIENPLTKKTETNYEQARFLIDTIEVLYNKTKGNLIADEEKLLDESLYNLRMIYIESKKNSNDK